MTALCRSLGVLPGAGGLLDQDSYHVYAIQETLAVLNEKEEMDIQAEKAKAKAEARRR
jgi:hypothetical protein